MVVCVSGLGGAGVSDLNTLDTGHTVGALVVVFYSVLLVVLLPKQTTCPAEKSPPVFAISRRLLCASKRLDYGL